MREIKFRAWYKDYNFMILPDEIAPYNYEIITGEGKVMEFEERHSYTGSTIEWEDISDKYVLMQYTGLTDKNGKEIYEGDVLQLAHPFKDRQYTGKVIFERGSFIAEDFWMTHYDNPSDFTEGLEHVEVIGNIYEYPHLLEESK